MLYAPPPTGVGDHVAVAYGGNGFGSTATKIRRFTTAGDAAGTAITYADSATAGATFTINAAGLYEICYSDFATSGGQLEMGITLNSAELTINVLSTAAASLVAATAAAASGASAVTRTIKLAPGDVLRPHTHGNNGHGAAHKGIQFSVRKVGNV